MFLECSCDLWVVGWRLGEVGAHELGQVAVPLALKYHGAEQRNATTDNRIGALHGTDLAQAWMVDVRACM